MRTLASHLHLLGNQLRQCSKEVSQKKRYQGTILHRTPAGIVSGSTPDAGLIPDSTSIFFNIGEIIKRPLK